MKIYLVFEEVDYCGDSLIGVYTSLEMAELVGKHYRNRRIDEYVDDGSGVMSLV